MSDPIELSVDFSGGFNHHTLLVNIEGDTVSFRHREVASSYDGNRDFYKNIGEADKQSVIDFCEEILKELRRV
jgi:hypothetical protein